MLRSIPLVLCALLSFGTACTSLVPDIEHDQHVVPASGSATPRIAALPQRDRNDVLALDVDTLYTGRVMSEDAGLWGGEHTTLQEFRVYLNAGEPVLVDTTSSNGLQMTVELVDSDNTPNKFSSVRIGGNGLLWWGAMPKENGWHTLRIWFTGPRVVSPQGTPYTLRVTRPDFTSGAQFNAAPRPMRTSTFHPSSHAPLSSQDEWEELAPDTWYVGRLNSGRAVHAEVTGSRGFRVHLDAGDLVMFHASVANSTVEFYAIDSRGKLPGSGVSAPGGNAATIFKVPNSGWLRLGIDAGVITGSELNEPLQVGVFKLRLPKSKTTAKLPNSRHANAPAIDVDKAYSGRLSQGDAPSILGRRMQEFSFQAKASCMYKAEVEGMDFIPSVAYIEGDAARSDDWSGNPDDKVRRALQWIKFMDGWIGIRIIGSNFSSKGGGAADFTLKVSTYKCEGVEADK